MPTIRIGAGDSHRLSFDLRHVLTAMRAHASASFWEVSGVALYKEALDVTGPGADQLEVLAASGERVSRAVLLGIAKKVHQVIWGEFRAYAKRTSQEPHIIVRAIDSSFYEITGDDWLLDRVTKELGSGS